MPVVEMSSGMVSDSSASPPPNSSWKRRSKASSSAAKVVRNCSLISALSDAISSRVLPIAVSMSARWASSSLEPVAQLGVFLDGERIAGAELVEAPAQRRQLALAGSLVRLLAGVFLCPARDDQVEQLLDRSSGCVFGRVFGRRSRHCRRPHRTVRAERASRRPRSWPARRGAARGSARAAAAPPSPASRPTGWRSPPRAAVRVRRPRFVPRRRVVRARPILPRATLPGPRSLRPARVLRRRKFRGQARVLIAPAPSVARVARAAVCLQIARARLVDGASDLGAAARLIRRAYSTARASRRRRRSSRRPTSWRRRTLRSAAPSALARPSASALSRSTSPSSWVTSASVAATSFLRRCAWLRSQFSSRSSCSARRCATRSLLLAAPCLLAGSLEIACRAVRPSRCAAPRCYVHARMARSARQPARPSRRARSCAADRSACRSSDDAVLRQLDDRRGRRPPRRRP